MKVIVLSLLISLGLQQAVAQSQTPKNPAQDIVDDIVKTQGLDIHATVATDAQSKLEMLGTADSKQSIATLLTALETHPLISQVYLVSVEAVTTGAQTRQAYEITADFAS